MLLLKFHPQVLIVLLAFVLAGSLDAEVVPRKTAGTGNQGSDLDRCSWLLMQDLVYALRTAPDPVADKESIRMWNQSINERISYLRDAIANQNVDEHVKFGLDELSEFTHQYSEFRDYMEVVKIAKDVRLLEGTPTWRSHGADMVPIAGSLISALFNPSSALNVVYEGASYGLKKWDEEHIRKSLVAKVEESNKDALEKRLAQQMQEYASCEKWLVKHCADMAAERNLPLPGFLYASGDALVAGPGDFFTLQAKACAMVETQPGTAGELMIQAAHQLPDMQGPLGAYITQAHRIPLLLQAVEALKFEARFSTSGSKDAPRRMIDVIEETLGFAKGGVEALPYPALLSYAWALAKTGQDGRAKSQEVLAVLKRCWARPGWDQFTRALHCYDEAVIYSMRQEHDKALAALRKSYEIVPRRDPMTLSDGNLAALLAVHSAEVKNLVDHPLVGGRWEWAAKGSQYCFYPGGKLQQRFKGGNYSGEWSMSGNTLQLFNRRPGGLDDSTYSITGDCITSMNMHLPQGVIALTRQDRSLLSNANFDLQELEESGRWRWADGRGVHFARFATIAFPELRKFQYWFLYEHPIKGRISFVQQHPKS